ncbi:MAG: glycosyltransferase, partial [Pseudolabrys sp.]|nr:glycosyltransferase [Pseudolabrys sp.]
LWARGVDAQRFRPRAHIERGWKSPVFLTVGRLAVEKNVEAFLSLDLPGTKVVVGDGPARAALQAKYPDTVFLGARHGEGLAQIYAAADVFVFPSLTDTFGLVMLEALASGVPVAAFPADAPRDVLATAGDAKVGVINQDLKIACLAALECSREACRDFALTMSWTACAQTFLNTVAQANEVVPHRPSRFRRLLRMRKAA